MKLWKTLVSACLAVSVVAGFAVTASADDFGDNFDGVTYDIAALAKAPTLDGKIDDGEYNKMEKFDDASYCVAVNAGRTDDDAWAIAYDYYTGWTADGYYFAVQMDAPNYACLAQDDGSEKPWWWHAVGVGLADMDATSQAEAWLYRRSDTGEVKIHQGLAGEAKPLSVDNLAITYENGVLTYECFLPWNSITNDDAGLASGDSFKLALAVGIGEGVKCIKALGGGTEPGPKGIQYFATVTLTGEAAAVTEDVKEEPKAEEPKTEEVKEEPKTEVKEEPKANAETSDSFVLIASVAAVLSMACALVVLKKKN